ncbi:MAG: hypothetical protein ABFC94_07245 [Syntrophomonas sp.]
MAMHGAVFANQETVCRPPVYLKERLMAIMMYSKKPKSIMLIALLFAVISGAMMLGGCIDKTNPKVSNEQEQIKDNFYESVNYNPGKDLLSFTIPKTIPDSYRFYLHVSGRMFMGDKSKGMSFHAFDEESQNNSWENGKTYTYSIKSESLDDCMLVFGLIDMNNQELLYTIHISPDGTKSLNNTAISNTKINDLISRIISSPKESSNPKDYIDAHKEEYDAIIKMDLEALPYLFAEFEKGGQTGLNGHIMESLCRNILGGEDIKYDSTDPQDWYETYKAQMCSLLEKNSLEFVKENYPKGSIVLNGMDLNPTYEVVNFADRQVEIAGRKLAYKATDLALLYKKLSAAQVEQMMYRAVSFYEAAFAGDLNTVNRLANKQLNAELKRWTDNLSKKEDYSAMPIMKLANYTDVASPTGISAPQPSSVDQDEYSIMLEISEDIQVQIDFEVLKEGYPLVAGFAIIM